MRAFLALVLLAGCGLGDAELSISGRTYTTTARAAAAPAPARTITHVMAVDPEAAAPRRTIAPVASDGSFQLSVPVGKPYVLVFVDATAVGTDMAVAIFRANTLDTISPQLAGHLDLGDVDVDPDAQTATAGIAYADLLATLGLDEADAAYLGSIDDLSLRYANPDIDGNGVIDLVEDHQLALDIHVRSNMRSGGRNATVADLTDQFLPSDGADVATPIYNLVSFYAMYPAGYDATSYVANAALAHGAAFSASGAAAPTSFSSLGFGDTVGWGADYDLERNADLELPGSAGSPATLAYTLGATATTLTFANVVTRTRASLAAAGNLAIFIRLATTGGSVTAIDYRWMKSTATAWQPATAADIALVIGSEGGFVSVHRVPNWHDESGVSLPAQPSGSVPWTAAPIRPDDICGLAVSYDDKLGLRHFVGGADPNPGVTCAF